MTQPAEILAFRPKAAQRVETVAYRRSWDDTKARASRRRGKLAERQAATVAKRLALAHHIAAQIEAGVYGDQADVARQHGLPRARLTQLMNLLLLAPDIQEEILALEVPAGRQPLSERALRRLTESLLWTDQRAIWAGRFPPRRAQGEAGDWLGSAQRFLRIFVACCAERLVG